MDHHGCARAVETFFTECQKLRETLVASLKVSGMPEAYVARIDSVVRCSSASLRAELGKAMDDIGSDEQRADALLLRIRCALAEVADAIPAPPK